MTRAEGDASVEALAGEVLRFPEELPGALPLEEVDAAVIDADEVRLMPLEPLEAEVLMVMVELVAVEALAFRFRRWRLQCAERHQSRSQTHDRLLAHLTSPD